MDKLKKSKEEDLEDFDEYVRCILIGSQWWDKHLRVENEKVKMFHNKLENENRRYNSDLNEISSDCDKAMKKRVRWEKEALNWKSN